MNVAIIPARGGSKRIPRKNIRPFAGKPMIAWSIDAARASGLFDRIVVSTDDAEIADVAQSCGAETPFLREPALADDHAGTLEVVTDAVSRICVDGSRPEAICCLYATAPFATAADLVQGREKLADGNWDYVFTATRYAAPVQRAFARSASGAMALLQPEHALTRSQELTPVYHDAGQYYWGTPQAWLTGRPIYGDRTTFVELPHWRVQDVDTLEDWRRAEHLFEILQRTSDDQ
jgi:N-acylneuraminate cytidylyltransferase